MHLGLRSVLRRTLFCITAGGCGLAGLTSPASAADTESAETLKSQADRWIELERRAADERMTWRTQKEVLTASVDVLQQERAALQERIAANELAAGLFRTRLDNARAELTAHETAHATLTAHCARLEKRLRDLSPRLPDPLRDKVNPLLEMLAAPPDDADTDLSEKVRSLVAALTAIDQFNNTLTVTHHLRQNGAGEKIDVKVLYWGLAAGFGIDATGRHAWTLSPGANGWEWADASAQADEINLLIAVHEKRENPQIVMLPIAAREGGAP